MANAAPTTPYQALYRTCMKEAAAQGRALMQRLVVSAGDAMQRASLVAPHEIERKLLLDASRTIVKHEASLCEAYPQALLSEFAQAIAGDSRKSGNLSFDSLELMGDAQVQESVDQMRLQQTVSSQVDAELSELNGLLCAVQGLKTMQADRSPLRPEVYVRSLRNVVMQSPVPPAVRMRWLQHMGAALGPELARVYRDLSTMLRTHGVEPAGFNTTQLRSGSPSVGAPFPGAAAAVHGSTLLNLKELRRLLSGEMQDAERDGGPMTAPTDFSMTVPAAFEVLQEMKQVDQVMDRLKQREADPGGPSSGRAALLAQASGPAQALALEVVNLMVEKVASDPRLLAPVQQTVRELEPALLRLALDDPRFFSDRKHPARQLLEELTQRSLAWDSIASPGFGAFIEPLQQAVEVLLMTRIAGAEPFEFALRTLQEAWGDAQKRDQHHREKAVRALLKAEQRNLLADRIAKEMRARSDVMSAPRQIGAFIAGPWSQVMAQARLSDNSGATDPGAYAALVADLLWSVQPRLSAANAARLSRFSSVLLDKIREGLSTIDYPASTVKKFAGLLGDLHQQAIAAAGTPSHPAPLEADAASTAPPEEEGGGAWLAPSEAKHSGFMDTDQSLLTKPLFQQTQPGFSNTQPGVKDELQAELPEIGLDTGAWVEMMIEGGWGRYQVNWASPHRTLFMFGNAQGKQHSMTRRLLAKMLKGGSLRLISDQTLLDGALDEVANEALKNSLDLKL